MKDFELLEKDFITYNPLVFDLDSISKTDVLGSIYDVRFQIQYVFQKLN